MFVGTLRSRPQPDAAPAESRPMPKHNLPPRDPKFVGRFSELEEVHELLTTQISVGITQQPTSPSDGGIGKTAIAIAYAWAHLQDYPGGVFYINGSRRPRSAELSELAGLLGVEPENNQEMVAAKVRQRLTMGPPSLLVVDNVDESGIWNEMQQTELLPEGNCRRLIVTRCQKLRDLAICTIDRLPRDHGFRLLAEYRADVDEKANQAAAAEIVDWLKGFPLALTLVGAYMTVNANVTWSAFRDELRKKMGISDDSLFGVVSASDYDRIVEELFDDLLTTLSPMHRVAMEYAGLMPRHHLSTKWLVELLGREDCTKVARITDGQVYAPSVIVSDLIFLQLLRSHTEGHKTLSLHCSVRKWLTDRYASKRYQFTDALDHIIPMVQQRVKVCQGALQKPTLRMELVPLMDMADDFRTRNMIELAAQLTNQLAPILHALGRDVEALEYLERFTAQNITDHLQPTNAAVMLSNKAVSLVSRGDSATARRLMEQALQIEQRNGSPDNPALAIRHSNLAGVLKSLGELVKARRHIETAIRIEEKHFGAEHLNLGIRHWWLGDIALAEEKKEEACAEYRRAYEIVSKHLPPEHQQVQLLTKILERHGASSGVTTS